jgi:hypothetical protein
MSGNVLSVFFSSHFSLSHTSEAMGAGNSSHHYLPLRRGASSPSPPPSPPPTYESVFGVASSENQYEQIDDEVVHSPLRRVSGPRRTDAHFWRGRRRPPAFNFASLTPGEPSRSSPPPPYSPPRAQPPLPPLPHSSSRPIIRPSPSAPPPPPPSPAVSPSPRPPQMRESTLLFPLTQPSSSMPPPRDEGLVMSLRGRDARLALLGHRITAMTREMTEREVREQ